MDTEVYSPTTAPNPKSSCFIIPSENLGTTRFVIKVFELVLSFVAFVLEEVISSCANCSALYFFEFVSCTAFLFTLLLLILLSTTLHSRVGISCWPSLDFVYTAVIALLFAIASIIFASNNSNTNLEGSAVAFGFLATLMFIVDIIWFVKNRGFPFKRDGKAESSHGDPVAVKAKPEMEKLNAPEGEAQ